LRFHVESGAGDGARIQLQKPLFFAKIDLVNKAIKQAGRPMQGAKQKGNGQ
jgi:hypothetical protein